MNTLNNNIHVIKECLRSNYDHVLLNGSSTKTRFRTIQQLTKLALKKSTLKNALQYLVDTNFLSKKINKDGCSVYNEIESSFNLNITLQDLRYLIFKNYSLRVNQSSTLKFVSGHIIIDYDNNLAINSDTVSRVVAFNTDTKYHILDILLSLKNDEYKVKSINSRLAYELDNSSEPLYKCIKIIKNGEK